MINFFFFFSKIDQRFCTANYIKHASYLLVPLKILTFMVLFYFRYARPLIKHLLHLTKSNGLTSRFSLLFEDEDLLVASALHLHFKMGVIRILNPEKTTKLLGRWSLTLRCQQWAKTRSRGRTVMAGSVVSLMQVSYD